MHGVKLELTGDGSFTLRHQEWDEIYHSSRGALEEAQHVYIHSGLDFVSLHTLSKTIRVLEIGWATGLNCLLSLAYVYAASPLRLHYVGLEPFPLSWEAVKPLNYPALKVFPPQAQAWWEHMHVGEWDVPITIIPDFCLWKKKEKIQDFNSQQPFDLVYYDAFGFRAQAEMWEEDVLQKVYDVMGENAVLVTYCAKGLVKRRLKTIGFEVQALPGPPGKREMIRAIKV